MELLTSDRIRDSSSFDTSKEVSRNWTFILYPHESCAMWLYELQMIHVATLISPLHKPRLDAQFDEESGGKEHHHVMFCFKGNKTQRSMYDLIAYLRYRGIACTLPQRVFDKVAMEEYFFHIGYAFKQQFPNLDDCACLNGYHLKVQDLDASAVLTEIVNYIRLTGEQFNYSSLLEFAIDSYPHWVSTIVNKSYAIQTLLRSYEIYGGTHERRIECSKKNIEVEQRIRGNRTCPSERIQEARVPQIR